MTRKTERMVVAVQENPRFTEKQKRTQVVEDLPGVKVEIASGYQTTMTTMIRDKAITERLIRVGQRYGTWTSVDNWDGETITGVRGTTHMAIVHQLRDDE